MPQQTLDTQLAYQNITEAFTGTMDEGLLADPAIKDAIQNIVNAYGKFKRAEINADSYTKATRHLYAMLFHTLTTDTSNAALMRTAQTAIDYTNTIDAYVKEHFFEFHAAPEPVVLAERALEPSHPTVPLLYASTDSKLLRAIELCSRSVPVGVLLNPHVTESLQALLDHYEEAALYRHNDRFLGQIIQHEEDREADTTNKLLAQLQDALLEECAEDGPQADEKAGAYLVNITNCIERNISIILMPAMAVPYDSNRIPYANMGYACALVLETGRATYPELNFDAPKLVKAIRGLIQERIDLSMNKEPAFSHHALQSNLRGAISSQLLDMGVNPLDDTFDHADGYVNEIDQYITEHKNELVRIARNIPIATMRDAEPAKSEKRASPKTKAQPPQPSFHRILKNIGAVQDAATGEYKLQR